MFCEIKMLSKTERVSYYQFYKLSKSGMYTLLRNEIKKGLTRVSYEKLQDLLEYLSNQIEERETYFQVSKDVLIPFSILMVGTYGYLPDSQKKTNGMFITALMVLGFIAIIISFNTYRNKKIKSYLELYKQIVIELIETKNKISL